MKIEKSHSLNMMEYTLGIREKNIYISPIDTFTNPDYYSYRRDGII